MAEPKNNAILDLSRLFSYPETLLDVKTLIESDLSGGVEVPTSPSLVKLQNEYVRLFINTLPEVPCSPYGSVYLEGQCMGETTVTIRNLYSRYGLETDEMPDSIAVELEFLNYLMQLVKVDESARADLMYMAEHLKSWAPRFLDDVEKHDMTGFYKAVAMVARNILLDLDVT